MFSVLMSFEKFSLRGWKKDGLTGMAGIDVGLDQNVSQGGASYSCPHPRYHPPRTCQEILGHIVGVSPELMC